MRKSNCETKVEVVGNFRIKYMVMLSAPILLTTLFTVYHISILHEDQMSYPDLSITGTGLHYPQCIIFRFGMGIFYSYFALIYHIIFVWIRESAIKYDYKGCTYSKMYWPTILSVIGYAMMIGTIDSQGTRSTSYQKYLHFLGALIFLLFLGFLVFNVTVICIFIWRKNRQFMKTWSLVLKIIIFAYEIVFIFIYLPLLAFYQLHFRKHIDFLVTFGNRAQWNLVIGSIIWMGLFSFDFQDVKVRLVAQKKLLKNVDEITIEQQRQISISEMNMQIKVPQTKQSQ